MSKRLLSSPKKRPRLTKPRVKGGSSNGATKHGKSSGTLSVADLFSKQRQNKTTVAESVNKKESEVIDLSLSPDKDKPEDSVIAASPYFSPTKRSEQVPESSLTSMNSLATKLNFKRKHTSEPKIGEEIPAIDMNSNANYPVQKKHRLSLKNKGATVSIDQQLSLKEGRETSSEDSSVLAENERSKSEKPSREPKAAKDDTSEEAETELAEDAEVYRVPYYIENFKLITKLILDDVYYEGLFNKEDLETVSRFNNLTEAGQKLYVRLFGRKFSWIIKSKIKYPKIAEDLTETLDELVSASLLDDECSMENLDEILMVMPAPDLQTLAKSFKLNVKDLVKKQIVEAVVKHSKQKHIGAFFKHSTNTGSVVQKRAKDLLGKCYRLVKECRAVFCRVMMLFSLHLVTGDEDEAGGQQQIFQMLMSNIGRIKYPTYTILRQTKIYPERKDLLNFEAAVQLSSDLYDATEAKDFEACMELYKAAKLSSQGVWDDDEIKRHDEGLPEYLRWFTAGAVYARIFTHGVEVLQRKKMYEEAVQQLEELTAQKLYHPDYRGRWYDRLALNTEQHLKQPGKALDIIKEALQDDRVRAGHRLSLFQRASRICHAKQHKKLHFRWKEFEDDQMASVEEAPKITIEGTQCPHSMPGEGRMWVTNDSYTVDNDEVTLIKRVEDVVLIHFRENGYPKGIHGEGSTFATLFCLFFWDIIFKDLIPDTFHSPYQSWPLDYATDYFYLNRKECIDDRLEIIRTSSEQELHDMASKTWTENEGTLCAGLNWERFLDLDHALGLISCMGGKVLAGIFDRMVKNMRHVRGGVPDLVVWNTETKQFRVVEVKGPNDKLSTKQILWLDYLRRLGVDAETCHVVAVAAKKLKTSNSVTKSNN